MVETTQSAADANDGVNLGAIHPNTCVVPAISDLLETILSHISESDIRSATQSGKLIRNRRSPPLCGNFKQRFKLEVTKLRPVCRRTALNGGLTAMIPDLTESSPLGWTSSIGSAVSLSR